MKTLALLHANFEQICAKKKVEKQLGRDLDESLKMLSDNNARCIRVAEFCTRIENNRNKGLKVIRNDFQETTTAILALTCDKNDRGHNEVPAGNLGHGELFAGQGYARRLFRGCRDKEVGGVMKEK